MNGENEFDAVDVWTPGVDWLSQQVRYVSDVSHIWSMEGYIKLHMFTPNLRYPIHCANSLRSSTISQPSHTHDGHPWPSMVLSLLKEALVWPCGPAHDASIVHFEARFIWTQALFQHLKFLHQTSALTDALTGHFFHRHHGMPQAAKCWGKKGPNKLRLSGLHNITYLGMSRNELDLHPIYGYLNGGYDDQPSKLRYPVTNPPASVCKNHEGVKVCPPLQDHEIQGAFTTSWSFTYTPTTPNLYVPPFSKVFIGPFNLEYIHISIDHDHL